MLEPWWRVWGICMEGGLAGKPSTTGSCSVVAIPIDPEGSPCWLPTTAVSAWSGHKGGRAWQWPISSMSRKKKLYPVDGRLRVCHLPSERFQQRCQACRVQAGGGSVHIWGAFHSCVKSPLVLPDCSPIEHIWDELGPANTSIDIPPQTIGKLHQALRDKWA